jgi:hypothetical protein
MDRFNQIKYAFGMPTSGVKLCGQEQNLFRLDRFESLKAFNFEGFLCDLCIKAQAIHLIGFVKVNEKALQGDSIFEKA